MRLNISAPAREYETVRTVVDKAVLSVLQSGQYVLHTRPLYKHLGYQDGDFPVAERIARELICLPVYSHLSDEEVTYIIDALTQISMQKDMAS